MSRLFDLSDQVALVTGGSSGMGQAIAEAMAEQGATVIVSSNDAEGCGQVVSLIRSRQQQASTLPCDMGDKEAINHLVNQAIALHGRVDVLVSCVGVAQPGSFLDITTDAFDKTMGLNLQSAIYLTKLVLPQMVERRSGAIIYLASIAGVRGNKALGLYGLSKAGLVQLARNLAVEFGPHNIRVNAISPGMIDTPFSRSLLENKAFMEKRLALTPLRRVGTTDEVAGIAVMLASRAGGFMTGQNIIADGGTTISDGN